MRGRTMRAAAAAAAAAVLAAGAAADFRACAEETGADVLGGGDAGFGDAVNRALYPSPAPQWYVDVSEAGQVAGVLACAKEEGLGVCPRSGGHSFVGGSSCEGVVLDVHLLKGVRMQAGGKEAVVGAGNLLSEMFYEVLQGTDGGRMVGIGLCPSVGVAGYMLGGGHNPYSGRLGLTCESVKEYEFVTPAGEVVRASKDENRELFWASCGGGGAHFGVLTQFTIETHDAAVFDRNVYFRYQWPIESAGEVLSKWLDYDQDGGDTWFRLEINALSPLFGYGVCWDVDSVDECEDRLGKADFFNVKGRFTQVLQKGDDVSQFQKFIGPAGKWGWAESKDGLPSDKDAFTGPGVAWDEGGKGLNRLYSSAYWQLEAKPSVEVLQQMAEICNQVDTSAMDFTLCQWNPWKGKQRESGSEHAFAHRGFDVFTELIGAGNDGSGEGVKVLKDMEAKIKALTGDYIGGIYVSYPEFGLAADDYQYLYWGQSLPRLAALREEMDPDGMFTQLQPLPSGTMSCPGEMSVTGESPSFTLGIEGVAGGQRPGMILYFSLPDGCSAAAKSGGAVSEAGASGVADGAGVYAATFSGTGPVAVDVDGGDDCVPELVAINGLMCVEDVTLDANKALSGKVESTGDEAKSVDEDDVKDGGDDSGGGRCFPADATVETRSRGVVRMDELAVGDEVRVAGGGFSPVFFFSHASAAVSSTAFLSVTATTATAPASCTSADADADAGSCAAATRSVTVVLTAGHYVPLADGGLKAASALSPGDALADGLVVSAVTDAGPRAGLYNPHTIAGTVVVDGVSASCYTTAVHPSLASAALWPLAAAWTAAARAPTLAAALAAARPALVAAIDAARPHFARALEGPSAVLPRA